MEKCGECGTIIYDSSRRRNLQKNLVEENKKYGNVINFLCVHCLEREIKKICIHKMLCKKSRVVKERIIREGE